MTRERPREKRLTPAALASEFDPPNNARPQEVCDNPLMNPFMNALCDNLAQKLFARAPATPEQAYKDGIRVSESGQFSADIGMLMATQKAKQDLKALARIAEIHRARARRQP